MLQKAKPNRKSQSALEYMMTYGWAILIIVIVAGVLYSLGIFTPSSSIGTTITGFNGLGSVTAQCYANGLLRIQLGNSVGNVINITKIVAINTATGQSASFTGSSALDPSPEISPSSSYIFSIANICPPAGQKYSLNINVTYTAPGQTLSGPYFSTGTTSSVVSTVAQPVAVASFDNYNHLASYLWSSMFKFWYTTFEFSYINATQSISGVNQTYTVTMWVESTIPYATYPPAPNSSNIQEAWQPIAAFANLDGLEISSATGNLAVHRCTAADAYLGPSNPVSNFYDGHWHFVAFSISATQYIGMVDGLSGTVTGTKQYSDGSQFFIGGFGGSGNTCSPQPFTGYESNVQLYNVPLSSAQLISLYDEGISGVPILAKGSGLVAWWPLNNTVNGQAKDYSGNGFNGQFHNASVTTDYISGAIGG